LEQASSKFHIISTALCGGRARGERDDKEEELDDEIENTT